MQKQPLKFIAFYLILALIAVLSIGMTSCSKTSSNTSLSSISVIPTSPDNLKEGYTQQFAATGTYSIGLTDDITNKVTWSSSNPTVATISSSGLATAVAAGTTSITATMSGVTGQPVSLTVITLSSIAVTSDTIMATPGSPLELGLNSSDVFKAVGTYSDGSTADISYHVTWASSNTNIAEISSLGVVTGKAAGIANITASLSNITSPPVKLTVISP